MNEKYTAIQQLQNFPNNLRESIGAHIKKTPKCDNIILCGMGGSGISNAIVYDCLYPMGILMKIVRTPEIPKWANEKTLAIISSYSGNTVETLDMYNHATEQKCKIVVITKGGLLEDVANFDNVPSFPLPSGMDPRHSIGYMSGYIFAIIRDVFGVDVTKKISDIIPELERYIKTLETDGTNQAREIGKNLLGKTTIVYYDKCLESIGFRWKSQISENAKYISIAEPMELLNSKSPGDFKGNYAIIAISSNKEKTAIAKKIAKRNKIYFNNVEIDSNDYICSLFKAILLGDFVSVYMAEMEGVDARDVTPITKLKKLMKENL